MKTSPFWTGFVAGVAAPALLFTDFYAPVLRITPPRYEPLYRPAKNANDAIRNDIVKIGSDFVAVTELYEQAQ